MDIKSTMQKFGFGHRCTNFIIIDRDGELWIAMAPQAVGGFLPMGATSLPGMLRIEPLDGGNPAKFTYTATEGLLELTTEKGAKVKIAIDTCANAVRITGNGSFRLNGVEPAGHMTTLSTDEGAVISSGAARLLISARKGSFAFDDAWVLNEFHSVTPVVEPKLDNNEFELVVFNCPADTETAKVTKTLDECAAESSADFEAFIDTLVDVPAEYAELKRQIAYPVWLCHRVLKGETEAIVANKYNDKTSGSTLMAIASLAFKDPARALEMLLESPAEMPGVAGIAALRLLDDNMLNDSRGDIYRAYTALETLARYCQKERRVDGDTLSFYAYRFESGAKKSPEFFKVGEPVLAPDLNAYLAIISEVIGKLAGMEYDVGIGQKWESFAKEYKTALIAELWNGEDFIGKNAYTGETSDPDTFLSLVPIVLGARLPSEIIGKLAAKIDANAVESAVGTLLVRGLYDAGEKDAAKKLAKGALDKVRAEGLKCPFYGAALLALAHKVL